VWATGGAHEFPRPDLLHLAPLLGELGIRFREALGILLAFSGAAGHDVVAMLRRDLLERRRLRPPALVRDRLGLGAPRSTTRTTNRLV